MKNHLLLLLLLFAISGNAQIEYIGDYNSRSPGNPVFEVVKHQCNCLKTNKPVPKAHVAFARLRNRKTEDEASLKKRFARSKRELKYEKKFDKVLVNDDLKIALKEAEEMVINFIKEK